MRNKLTSNQLKRKRRREREKRQKRLRLSVLGLALVVGLSFYIRSNILESDVASADTARVLSQDEAQVETNDLKVDQKANINEPEGYFTDKAISYKRVTNHAFLLEQMNLQSNRMVELKSGDYIMYFGSVDGWAKVKSNNVLGYVKNDLLEGVKDNNLKTKDGLLIITKTNPVPEDFKTSYDKDTQNSISIAVEAMKRENLYINIGRTVTTFEEESNYITNKNSEYDVPGPNNSELRSGFAVELYSRNTDPRIQSDFF